MSHPKKAAPAGSVIGYTRVSTSEQVDSGLGLEAQRAGIEAEAARRGLTVVGWFADEGVSGAKGVDARPGLAAALDAIDNRTAAGLLVLKGDRVARSLLTLLTVVQRVERAGATIAAADGTIDTTTPQGRFMTQLMGSVSELERAMISQRTKDALAAKRARGEQLGKPSGLDRATVARIVSERAAGASLRAIAAGLTADNIPTSRGKATWYAPAVKAVLEGQAAAELAATG